MLSLPFFYYIDIYVSDSYSYCSITIKVVARKTSNCDAARNYTEE